MNKERAPEQGMESGILQEESNLRSSSSMTLHPRGALRAGEALQLLQGGDGQPMEEVEQGQRRRLPEGAEESARKSQRLGEDTAVPEPEAKRGKTLYRPTFAGQVRQVIEDVEIYVDEEPEVDSQIEDEFDQIDLTELSEKDGPPEVSGEQLKVLDSEAMMKEVEKLKDMEVIRSILLRCIRCTHPCFMYSHSMAHAKDDTPQWFGSRPNTGEKISAVVWLPCF